MIESLAEWNEWWSTRKVRAELLGKPRHLSQRFDELTAFREIKTITGLRRTGKSTILFQFVDRLIRDLGVDPRNILYVNFDDPVLAGKHLKEVFDSYQRELNPPGKPYLFLDEVHNCPDWALFLKKIYDLRKLEQAFVTDSSSKYVLPEYSNLLTGRQISIRVRPLSFRELLNWHGFDAKPPFPSSTVNKLRHHLDDYLAWGGMPEVVLRDNPAQKRQLLNGYLADIIHKDVVERHNAKYHKVKMLADFILSNAGSLFSPRKFSRAHDLSLDSINRYMGYMAEVYLIDQVSKYDQSLRKRQINPKKVYVADNGFANVALRLGEGRGGLVENAVHSELARLEQEIFYWKGKGECDFVLAESGRPVRALQACDRLTADNVAREQGGLRGAMESLDISSGELVANDSDVKGAVPLWKWLMEAHAARPTAGARE
ncbi:MAG: ATP-binding protein [Thermoplasmata archaeon]|nr:ATP-binding protein [Thermoplasmata archaeon]